MKWKINKLYTNLEEMFDKVVKKLNPYIIMMQKKTM